VSEKKGIKKLESLFRILAARAHRRGRVGQHGPAAF